MTPHELRFLAVNFDLSRLEERARSARWLAAFYFELVEMIAPEIVAEIGAFDARFSQTMKAKLPQAHAVAFEANPYAFAEHHTAADSAGVDYRHLAIADSDGETTFNVRLRSGQTTHDKAKPFDSLLERDLPDIEYERVTVPCARADSFFSAAPYAEGTACLWIDVEGAAGAVLQGAERLLARTSGILIEVENSQIWRGQWTAHEVHDFLTRRGFIVIARDFEYERQHNLLYIDERVARLPGYDGLVTHWYSRSATTARRLGAPAQALAAPL